MVRPLAQELVQVVVVHYHQMNTVNFCTAYHRIAKHVQARGCCRGLAWPACGTRCLLLLRMPAAVVIADALLLLPTSLLMQAHLLGCAHAPRPCRTRGRSRSSGLHMSRSSWAGSSASSMPRCCSAWGRCRATTWVRAQLGGFGWLQQGRSTGHAAGAAFHSRRHTCYMRSSA